MGITGTSTTTSSLATTSFRWTLPFSPSPQVSVAFTSTLSSSTVELQTSNSFQLVDQKPSRQTSAYILVATATTAAAAAVVQS